jgi:hypothetical protein
MAAPPPRIAEVKDKILPEIPVTKIRKWREPGCASDESSESKFLPLQGAYSSQFADNAKSMPG